MNIVSRVFQNSLVHEHRLQLIHTIGLLHNIVLPPSSSPINTKRDNFRAVEEALNNLYSSVIIVQAIKSRKMRWAGYVGHMWEEERHIQSFGGET